MLNELFIICILLQSLKEQISHLIVLAESDRLNLGRQQRIQEFLGHCRHFNDVNTSALVFKIRFAYWSFWLEEGDIVAPGLQVYSH